MYFCRVSLSQTNLLSRLSSNIRCLSFVKMFLDKCTGMMALVADILRIAPEANISARVASILALVVLQLFSHCNNLPVSHDCHEMLLGLTNETTLQRKQCQRQW